MKRLSSNPILKPHGDAWASHAVFNPSVLRVGNTFVMTYRAMGHEAERLGQRLRISRIGVATSTDGLSFGAHSILLEPKAPWDYFGCEDPRVTFFEGQYYLFYTALGGHPFSAANIHIGVALSQDMKAIGERYRVTPFNAKAMTLFPERIGGKITAILSVNTDRPPATMAIFQCDKIEELWDPNVWYEWYSNIHRHAIDLSRMNTDQIEVGATPVKTADGWLLVYSHIKNYQSASLEKVFGIEAALLAADNPRVIIGRTAAPLLVPEAEYERKGIVPKIVFPTSVVETGDSFTIYYGAADTSIAAATISKTELKQSINPNFAGVAKGNKLHYPIIEPRPTVDWEQNGTFNPGVYDDGTNIHILYRAQSNIWSSTIGYARLNTPYNVVDRPLEPCYVPRESFEKKRMASGYSGCEDARLTRLGQEIYMCYTAFDGVNSPRVALTHIAESEFLRQNWAAWAKPKLISAPGVMNKNTLIFPEKIGGKIVMLHRIDPNIYVELLSEAEFASLGETRMLEPKRLFAGGEQEWEGGKIGANCPPHRTGDGWLLFYHGVDRRDSQYRLGAMLLALDDPQRIIARSRFPILEPQLPWECSGVVRNVVFPCGSALREQTVYIYYGAADFVLGVASFDLQELLSYLKGQGITPSKP